MRVERLQCATSEFALSRFNTQYNIHATAYVYFYIPCQASVPFCFDEFINIDVPYEKISVGRGPGANEN